VSCIRLALPLACVSVLIGCSEAPLYSPPSIPAPASYKGSTAIWQPAQPADNLPRGAWWKAYKDPTLDDLVARLDQANSDLVAAVAHLDQANAYAAQARAGYFPTLSAGAFMTRNRQSDTRALRSNTQPDVYGDNSIGLMANYEVDLWGHVRNQVEAGKAGAQAAAADLESIRLSLRAELVNDYLALRMLDAQSQLLSEEVNDYAKALELTQNRFQGQVASELDVSQAKVQLDTARAKAADISASRALYEHAIATLVGESASGFSILPAVIEIQLPTIPVGVPATLLQRRPDIAAAERRLAEANAEVGVAKSAFFPTVNLSAIGGYESTYQAGWLSAPNLFWSIGPNALLTIFDAGRRQAVAAQAEAAFRVAGAQYRSAVLHAFQEVEDSLSLLAELSAESIALSAAVKDSRHTLDIAMNRYQEGIASYLEVVIASASALQIQLDELSLRTRRLQASVNLIRALGGGWDATQMSSQ
jgi:NodT family efflux transporter outer membrane factor (OMF) lipoprotein